MKPSRLILIVLFVLFLLFPPIMVEAQEEPPVVRAVLFYSPTCPHCEFVISNTLPPLVDQYGSQLELVGVDVTRPAGGQLFQSALQHFKVESGGVPFLVIGDTYLIGSDQIPEQLPGLIESNLASGGVDWPEVPGLERAIQSSQDAQMPSDIAPATQPSTILATRSAPAIEPGADSPVIEPGLPPQLEETSWTDKFSRDPLGNSLSVILLLVMLAAIAWSIIFFQKKTARPLPSSPVWLVPLLCLLGAAVAGYLAYVESSGTSAVCGPVGDCNAVQQSEYARLFGLVPIGILGLVGYAAIGIAWVMSRSSEGRLADLASLGLFVMAYFGTLFSIYLTFLEPFIIGATCAWCLTSAFLITALMLVWSSPARSALSRLVRASAPSA